MLKFRVVYITLLFLLLGVSSAMAEPLFIEFNEMIHQAPHIVLAEYLGGYDSSKVGFIAEYQLLIKKVLKGNLPLGNYKVGRAQGGVEYELKPHTLCIVFINGDNGFEWVATPFKSDDNIENSALYLRGFYDYNAYLVYPSMITLPQLQQYLQTETMKYQFEGVLHFFSSEAKKLLPSAITFQIEYTYQAGKSTSQVRANHLKINDFPKNASASLSAWSEPTLSVVYEPNMVRPLKFQGEVEAYLSDNQTFKTIFWAEAPSELSERLFQDYLQHEPYGMPYYELLIDIEAEKSYQLFINDEANRGTYLRGFDNRILYYSSFSEEEMIFPMGANEFLIIRVPNSTALPEQLKFARGSVNRLIRMLKIQSLQGQIWRKKDNQETLIAPCTLVLKRTHFNKNLNFRKK